MGYEDGAGSGGGCLSAMLTLILLPYILVIYGYVLLAFLAIWIFEWIQANIFTILLYIAPISLLYFALRKGLVTKVIASIKDKKVKSQYQPCEFKDEDLPHDVAPKSFIPSTNLYCYWCTRKLGLQSWERGGKYYCQECYEKRRL